MIFRLEHKKDYFNTERLTREAFWDVYQPGCSEHLVLHNLRYLPAYLPQLHLVAEDGQLTGSIVYSRMYFGENEKKQLSDELICFGPLSVAPEYQRQGLGGRLIRRSLAMAAELGFKAVLITGSPEYYRRFGFTSAARTGIFLTGMDQQEESPFFMAHSLAGKPLSHYAGVYQFDPTFEVDEKELAEFEKKFPEREKREPKDTDL